MLYGSAGHPHSDPHAGLRVKMTRTHMRVARRPAVSRTRKILTRTHRPAKILTRPHRPA